MFILLLLGWLDWQTLKTDNFTIIYKPKYEWEARQALQNLEYYKSQVDTLTGNPIKHFPVVIEDIGTISNGFADPVFRNIHLYTYPPDGEGIGITQNWYREVGLHEYTHISHLTKTSGLASATSILFGTIFQPNMYAPGWVAEGITVYSESQFSQYEGRLNDGYFDAYIGARAREKSMPSVLSATYSPLEFPGSSGIYLYGGEFFNYLSQRYGERKFAELFATYGSYFWAPFLGAVFPSVGIDMAAGQTYGKSLYSLFSEWTIQQEEKYKDEKIEGEQVTNKGWYISYFTKDGNSIYYWREYPKKADALQEVWFNEIYELNIVNQKECIVASLTAPVSTPIIIKDKKLYYSTYEFKNGYANITKEGFGFISTLHLKDLNNGKDKVLFSDNIRAFCVLEDSSILYSKDKLHEFGSELWIYKNGKKELIWSSNYLLGELKSNSKYIIVSARKDFDNWDVYLFDLDNKKFIPIATTSWTENNIELQGDTIIFTANYDKIYSIYAYDLAAHKLYRLTSSTGYACNGVIYSDTLYFIGLTKDGFDIYKEKLKLSDYQTIRLSDHQTIAPDFSHQALPKRGNYLDVLYTLSPAIHIPFIMPINTTFRKWWLGGVLVGADATYENTYAIFLANNPLEDELFLDLYFNSMFCSPMAINFQYQHKKNIQSQFSYPLLKRLKPGLSDISFFTRARIFDNNFARKEIIPGVLFGFRFPATHINLKGEFPIELNSNRTAQYFQINVENYIRSGEVRFLANGYNDPANPDSIGIKIRGYPYFYAKTGTSFTVEYSRPMLKIRKGLWNPNIFFEDLCGAIFTDIALLNESEYKASLGVELKLETGIMFGFIKFAPKVGIAVTKTGKIKFYPSIELR
ncbi:MAG: hypothetical protein HY769_07840 [Candidatus Stahlbacteria bacterium]|nr:hypothetical protein [Candidatus Stahlbacteria bacterium]